MDCAFDTQKWNIPLNGMLFFQIKNQYEPQESFWQILFSNFTTQISMKNGTIKVPTWCTFELLWFGGIPELHKQGLRDCLIVGRKRKEKKTVHKFKYGQFSPKPISPHPKKIPCGMSVQNQGFCDAPEITSTFLGTNLYTLSCQDIPCRRRNFEPTLVDSMKNHFQ